VLTTPVVRCLKQQFEGDVEIHYLTKTTFIPLLQHNPYIEKLHGILESASEIRHALIAENFDYVIDLHKNLRTQKVKHMLKAPSFSFDKLNWEKWLTVNFKVNKMPDIHIVDRYLNTLKKWDIVNDNKGLDYFLGENDIVKDLPLEFKGGYIGISVGAAHATKALPKEKMRDLVEKLNYPVILLGGKEDVEKANFVSNGISSSVLNACGKYSINQSAFLIKNAKVIISHDTGIMHISSAFNKPTISIWGNTIPEFGMSAYIPQFPEKNKIFEVENLKCRPCTKIGYKKCPKKHFNCMNLINIDEVANQAKAWLS
jgi:heptosyltransferase-2